MSADIVKRNADLLNTLKSATPTNSLLKDLKGAEKVDKLILVLLDTSGSMCESMGSNSKIDTAWQVFKNQLLPNMSNWSYGIIGFGDEAYWVTYPTSNPTALVSQNPYASGMTSMAKALQIAWSWIKTHAKEARIVVLSDGRPNDMEPDDIVKLVIENKQIPIDTVGIGNRKHGIFSSYDPQFLKRISEITGGMFTEVSTADLLAETIKKLSPINRPLLGKVEKEVP